MMARDSWRSDEQGQEYLAGPTSPASQHRQIHRQSMAGQPLLAFDPAEGPPGLATSPGGPSRARQSRGRSVFGSDKIWEREVEKLRLAEEAERAANEAKRAEKERRDRKQAKKARKGKGREMDLATEELLERDQPHVEPLASPESAVEDVPQRRSSADLLRDANKPTVGVDDWAASSDEEGIPARRIIKPVSARQASSDSDSDVPLSRIRAKQPMAQISVEQGDSSSEDEEPLSRLMQSASVPSAVSDLTLADAPLQRGPTQASAKQLPTVLPDTADEDEDDVPLALRRLTLAPRSAEPYASAEDEDDVPLGLRHAAARAQQQGQPTQEQAMALFAAQQHYEQMQRQSMFGAMGMMGMGGMPAMAYPQIPPAGMMGVPGIPGMPYMDPAAFGASMASLHGAPAAQDPGIDRWRRQVEPKEGSVFSERTSLSQLSALRSEVGV